MCPPARSACVLYEVDGVRGGIVLCIGRLRSRRLAAYPEAWWAVISENV